MIINITLILFAVLFVLKVAGISSMTWVAVMLAPVAAFAAMVGVTFLMELVKEILNYIARKL